MSGTLLTRPRATLIQALGAAVLSVVELVGDMALFAVQTLLWIPRRIPRGHVLWPVMYEIGVQSVPVITVTGAFIGMVLAVQTYEQFAMLHMENQLGAVINVSLVKELGPVLAGVMLAGRLGGAIAAELGTMKITEQIDALTALGANPVAYLAVPRFIACCLLIPLLTVIANVAGMASGWWFSVQVLGIDSHFYWFHTEGFVAPWDYWTGLLKSVCFGGCIAMIACHRGFHCRAGAEGVGRAATEAFVYSFVAILAADFLIGTWMMKLYHALWGVTPL